MSWKSRSAPALSKGQVTDLVQDEQRGREVLFQLGLQPVGRLHRPKALKASTAVAKRTGWPV